MKLFNRLKLPFPRFNRETQELGVVCDMKPDLKVFYKLIAIETAINLISNTLGLMEFKTFEKGEEVRKESYYLFNIQPNLNYNSSRFWRKLYRNLVYNNEALILMQRDGLFIIDEFERKEYAFKENIYKDLKIKDYKLEYSFEEHEVFYFELHSQRMMDLIDSIYLDYGNLFEYSKDTYKRSNAKRGTLEIPTNYPQTPQAMEQLNNLLSVKFKQFFHAESGAVLPLTNNLTYTDLSAQTYKNGSDSRDIKNLLDDVFDFVAIAFQIPPQMLKGNIADSDKTWSNYMTHCIRPLAELIEDEINRKFYTKKDYLDKNYVRVDTTNLKYIDLKDLAQSIDLLSRNGVNTINDNRRLLGREGLNDKYGDIRFMSLNLDTLDNIIKRGEQIGQAEDRLPPGSREGK